MSTTIVKDECTPLKEKFDKTKAKVGDKVDAYHPKKSNKKYEWEEAVITKIEVDHEEEDEDKKYKFNIKFKDGTIDENLYGGELKELGYGKE